MLSKPVLLLLAVVILIVGGYYLYRNYAKNGLTTLKYQTSSPSSATVSKASDPDLQALYNDTTALDQDLTAIENSLNDKAGDLSE